MIGDNWTYDSHAGQMPVDRPLSGSFTHRTQVSPSLTGPNASGVDAPVKRGQSMFNDSEQKLLYEQSLIYAEDMAKIYEQEKQRRKALEKANAELTAEISARRRAEDALWEAQRDLEEKVEARTVALSETNKRLQEEVARRERSEEETRVSLKEKEILLAEIHHRVKNNLQIISSLLALQANLVADRSVRDVLEDSKNRIRSIALIHEQIYRSNDFAQIDFRDYIQALTASLLKNHSAAALRISISTDERPIFLRMDKALPCSLIINELVTNCLKHAFPSKTEDEIRIGFHRGEFGGYVLTVADNGRGFPDDLDFRSTRSLGLQLVVNLAEVQLQGTIEMGYGGGTEFRILFPEERTVPKGKEVTA